MNQELLSAYLKKLRGEKRQADLGKILGVTQEAYGLYESGKRKIKLEKLLLLVEKLDGPKEDFIKLLFPQVEQVVLTGVKASQFVISKEDYDKIKASLETLDSIFLPDDHSKTDKSQGQAKMDEVPLGRIKSRSPGKVKGKRTGIS